MPSLLRLNGIHKSFGTLKALSDVSLELNAGEIHALVGENGAGKSTLMNIAFGLLKPDAGQIVFKGTTYNCLTPQKAMSAGIGMVHQHFKLVDEFSARQNIALGSSDWKNALSKSESSRLNQLCKSIGLDVDLDVEVARLSVGQRQRVEILKALFSGADLLILDEPTAVLTPQETQDLFSSLRELASSGTAVVIITHKIADALSIAAKITVLRAGKVVLSGSVNENEFSEIQIASAMVGREVIPAKLPQSNTGTRRVLEIRDLSYTSRLGRQIQDVSITVNDGEILGIAGVEGNGQDALAEALTGLLPTKAGSIIFEAEDISSLTVAERLKKGIVSIPGDRHRDALALDFTLQENVLLSLWPDERFRNGFSINIKNLKEACERIITEYSVKDGAPEKLATTLSGGNQQRFVIGRQMLANPKVFVAANPTRGLDIGAMEYVHQQLLRLRSEGCSVILISTDLDEIIALSDRIAVLYEGKIIATFRRDTNREKIGLVMAGGKPENGV